MENKIRHEGIVEAKDGCHIKVRILQASACAGCKVAAHCNTADSKEKIVDVIDKDGHWQIGQSVVVSTRSSMASRALLIGFGLPLMLMLVLVVVLSAARCSEGMTALLMLGSLIPYYLVVWLCRDRIARNISFQLEETN